MAEIPMNNNLTELRSKRNWSQGDLAERLDVSRQTINALERGRYDPSLPLAFKISELFGLPIEEIFQADGHTKKSKSD
jgi:putative transcriptional regulator